MNDQATLLDQLHPIFRECCAPPHCAPPDYNLNEPFVSEGILYASNGHIIVRTPWPNVPDSKGDLPPVEALEWDRQMYVNTPLPRADLPEPRRLKRCRGCDASGRRGFEPCWDCEGEGFFHPEERAVVYSSDVFIAERYVRLIQQHGGRIYLRKDWEEKGIKPPHRFEVSQTIDGLVMGLDPSRWRQREVDLIRVHEPQPQPEA